MPIDQNPIGILQIKVNKICPALMLANKRKHKVTGRTKMLVTSTILRNGTKYHGEFAGKTAETMNWLILWTQIPLIQKSIAEPKLNPKLVVTGKLYRTIENKFNIARNKQ